MQKNKSRKFNKYLNRIIIAIVIILICFLALMYILKSFIYPTHHFEIIKKEASKNNVDPYLILAIIKTESGFDSLATSHKNARGLMQIMDSTAEDINRDGEVVEGTDGLNIYDEATNIALGCKYFASLVTKYNGNYYLAICAYNAGMGNVDKWINEGIINNKLDSCDNNNIPYEETKKYLKKVITSYKMYRMLYN